MGKFVKAKVSDLREDGSIGWVEIDVERFTVTVGGVDFDLMRNYNRSAAFPDRPPCWKISDYKSGYSFVVDDGPFEQEMIDQRRNDISSEAIGEYVVQHCVDKYGMDKVMKAIKSKPVLNKG